MNFAYAGVHNDLEDSLET